MRASSSPGSWAGLGVAVAAFAVLAVLAGCGGSTRPAGTAPASSASASGVSSPATGARPPAAAPKPLPPPYPVLLRTATGSVGARLTPVVRWRGQTAVWIARLDSGVTMLSFDQGLVRLALHSGTIDPGGSGWRHGPAVVGAERARLVAAFNGGFRLSIGAGGFMSGGRVAVALRDGLGSIVTYADGRTDIGAWNAGVPRRGRALESVRQNLTLLIDHGQAASTLDCLSCWGATLGGVADVARSALGITPDGQLVWAGGEGLSVAALADALLHAHVRSAVELDINPAWVAGYMYRHHGPRKPLAPVPVLRDQVGASGFFLQPYSRDFFTILTR